MASILLTIGVLSYDTIKKQKAKRAAAKRMHNDLRFAELEAENERRVAASNTTTCDCQRNDWQGGECGRCGYVPAGLRSAAGGREGEGDGNGDVAPPKYEERDAAQMRTRIDDDAQRSQRGHIGQRDRRSEGGGYGVGIPYSNGEQGGREQVEDVARINEERRRKGRWRLRRKGKGEEGVVR